MGKKKKKVEEKKMGDFGGDSTTKRLNEGVDYGG